VIVVDDNPEKAAHLRTLGGPISVVNFNDLWRNRSNANSGSNGAHQWMLGTQLAQGDVIAFIGDDDEYLPRHVEAHVEALEETGVDYSLSKGEFWCDGEFVFQIGDGQLKITHFDTDAIVGRRETFRVANWHQGGTNAPDFDLVLRWHNAGLKGAFVDEVTYRHHDGWLKKAPEIVAAAKAGQDWRKLLVVA